MPLWVLMFANKVICQQNMHIQFIHTYTQACIKKHLRTFKSIVHILNPFENKQESLNRTFWLHYIVNILLMAHSKCNIVHYKYGVFFNQSCLMQLDYGGSWTLNYNWFDKLFISNKHFWSNISYIWQSRVGWSKIISLKLLYKSCHIGNCSLS